MKISNSYLGVVCPERLVDPVPRLLEGGANLLLLHVVQLKAQVLDPS